MDETTIRLHPADLRALLAGWIMIFNRYQMPETAITEADALLAALGDKPAPETGPVNSFELQTEAHRRARTQSCSSTEPNSAYACGFVDGVRWRESLGNMPTPPNTEHRYGGWHLEGSKVVPNAPPPKTAREAAVEAVAEAAKAYIEFFENSDLEAGWIAKMRVIRNTLRDALARLEGCKP